MREPAESFPNPPTSAVRNTVGKGNEQILKYSNRPASYAALREYCDKHYHQLLPIIAEKVHQEKVQQEKLKEVKARLNFEGCSRRNSKIQEVLQHFESRKPNIREEYRRGRRSGRSRSMSGSPKRTSVFSRIRRDRSESPKHRPGGKGRRDGGVFNRLGAFLGREVAASNQVRKKTLSALKQQEAGRKQNFDRMIDFRNQYRSEWRRDKFTHLTKSPKEILALDKGDAEHSTSTWMNFVVVRSPSLYNGIIRRQGVRKIQAVPSTAHGMLKFPVSSGILTLQSSRIILLECTMVIGPKAQPFNVARTAEERIKVAIHPEYPEKTIAIGSTLTEEGRKALCRLLRRNLHIFA
ncbi:hypothetical protein Tco_0856011 [Tanacetum coccineum]